MAARKSSGSETLPPPGGEPTIRDFLRAAGSKIVLVEIGKLDERTTAFTNAVEKLDESMTALTNAIEKLSDKLDLLQQSINSLNATLWVLTIVLPLSGLVFSWAVVKRVTDVLEVNQHMPPIEHSSPANLPPR